MQTLGDKQELFTYLLAQLIIFAYGRGFKIRMGEVERSKAQAEANARAGIGIATSLHTKRLAADLHLFQNGVYLTETEDHRPLGEFWKTLHPLCRWGGDFRDSKGSPKPDGNHYSLFHDGRA